MGKESTSTKGQVKRWSVSRKMDIVMRSVGGETIEDLSLEDSDSSAENRRKAQKSDHRDRSFAEGKMERSKPCRA